MQVRAFERYIPLSMTRPRKRDKMRCLLSILSLFRNEFNKFNNTGALILDFIYLVTFKMILESYSTTSSGFFIHQSM